MSVHDCRELDPAGRNIADAWFRAIRVRDYAAASEVLRQLSDSLDGPEHASLRAAITRWFVGEVLPTFLPEQQLEQIRDLHGLTEVRQTMASNMVKWSEEWIAKGQRGLLVRQAQVRFGDGVAAEVAGHLDRVSSPEALGAIGEWLLVCPSGNALVSKVREACGQPAA